MSSRTNISEDQVNNFCAVTGANPERARFYLEASNGDLDMAIGSFFEGGGLNETEEAMNQAPTSRTNLDLYDENSDDEDNDPDFQMPTESRELPKSQTTRSKTTKSSGGSARIFTLRDQDENEEEDDDEEKGQAFYAGGSEASGQQIIGPSKKKAESIIQDLFRKAKEHGAQVVDSSEASTSSRGPVVYGTGYRLGTGSEPQEIIRGPEPPKPPKSSILKLWKNGFNIDDGQLRSYDDPKNKEFLDSIQRGELPQELVRQAQGGEVHLDMQDHREEEFVPPKNKYVLYNDGYKLGSPTPTVVSTSSATDQESNENLAKQDLKLDETRPTTQIQVRLSNGSRLIVKANQTHRLSEIRKYINRARPEYSSRVYSLMTSFPNKEIENETQTLQEANLLNAVIIQKLKE